MDPYATAWLDSLMQSSDLAWFGRGDRKIGFAFGQDLDLFLPGPGYQKASEADTEEEIKTLLPEHLGRYSFFDISRYAGLNSEQTAGKLWDFAWKGKVLNDSFAGLRMGVLNKFKPSPPASRGRGRRGQFNRWKSSRPLLGAWYLPDMAEIAPDIIEKAEIEKDRARQLFRRYGVLFRDILLKKVPELRWGSLFKTLRLMELSGEILSGYFFEGISGLQFISYEALRFLQNPLPLDAVFWLNATDPASFCGTQIKDMDQPLPQRLPFTDLVFHGTNLVILSKRSGKHLDIRVPHDHPFLPRYLEFFKKLVGREFNPRKFILVETINDEPSAASPYAEALLSFGFSKDYKGLELRRKY